MTSGILSERSVDSVQYNIQYNNVQLPPTTTSTVVHVRSSECAVGISFISPRLCPSTAMMMMMMMTMMIVTHNLCEFSGKIAKFWVRVRIVDFRTLLIKVISSKPSLLTPLPSIIAAISIVPTYYSKACITMSGTNVIKRVWKSARTITEILHARTSFVLVRCGRGWCKADVVARIAAPGRLSIAGKTVLSCCSVVVYDNHRAHDRYR
jgi:hypothetical protein